jgi:organic hydroperoxide reductase OsmC/OhrA
MRMHDSPEHTYGLVLAWEGNRGGGTTTYDAYGREFRVTMAGKPDLLGSADGAFKGDPAFHNPEDLLVAAIAACHMLTYLALASRRGLRVVAYTDEARGVLIMERGGGGRFRDVTLRPRVTVATRDEAEPARALHKLAGGMCFIARSCNFPIAHEPEVVVGGSER